MLSFLARVVFSKFKQKLRKLAPGKPQIILVVLALIFSLVILEIVLRVFGTKEDPVFACRESDPELHHRLKPNSSCRSQTSEWNVFYWVNSLGLRDKEILPKADGEFRILVLGDSFTEGVGVESDQRFTKIMEDKLIAATGKKIKVINAGVSTYSPILELTFLKKYLGDIQPDLVMVALDMTDFRDEIGYYNFLNEKNKAADLQFLNEKNKAADLQFLSAKEYLAEATQINSSQKNIQTFKKESGWQQNKKLPFAVLAKMFFRKSNLYVALTNIMKGVLNKPYLVYGSPPFIAGDVETDIFAIVRNDLDEQVYQALWILPKKSFGEFSRFAKENNLKLAFFTYPHGMQIDGRQWGKGRLTRGFLRGEVYATRPLADLVLLGNSLSVPSVSLLSDFRRESSKKLYFDWDGHLTILGHEVAGRGLAKFILDSGLLN